MKNSKKILGIILTICMLMQMLPVFVYETEAQTSVAGGRGIDYLINDEFSAATADDDGLSGWCLVKDNGHTEIPDDLIITEEIKDSEGNGTGNYAMKYSVTKDTWLNSHITKALATPAIFETGTDVVIETRVMQNNGYTYDEAGNATQASSGRSFLKYNFVAEEDAAEYNFNWGTLVANNKGNMFGTNGWTKKNNETNGDYYDYPTEVSLGKATANEWYNVKVIIHGTTGGTANTADYIITADDGTVIGKTSKSVDINFPENSKWYYDGITYVDPAEEQVAWVENALNTVDFRQREANTLYVDYVRVYEVKQEEVRANLVDGRYVQYDENIEVKLTTEAESLTLIEETAKLTTAAGAEVGTSVSYADGILTVNPTDDLTVGDIYNLTFTDNEFNKFTGTKTFELEARAARSHGVVVDDDFDADALTVAGDATESGWYLGKVTDEKYKGTLAIVDATTDENAIGATGKALKVSANFGSAATNAAQTYITKKIGGGIEYRDNVDIVIKTRVKHTNENTRLVMVGNRPDTLDLPENALGQNRYNLFHTNNTAGIQVYNITSTAANGGTAILDSTVVTAGKWIEAELKIHGAEHTMDISVTIEDGEESKKFERTGNGIKRTVLAMSKHYGEGTPNYAFDALERLGFTFREGGSDTLYIDYVKVWESTSSEVRVNTVEGKTFETGKAIEFKVTATDGASVSDTIVDTATVSVEAEKSYENGILTITPKAVNEGDTVTVTFANNDYVKFVDSTTSFTLTARGARSEGLVVNSTFDGLNLGEIENAEGWYLGAVKDDTHKGTLTVVDSTTDANAEGAYGNALKFTGAYAGTNNGDYSYLTREIGEGIEYAENKNVVIKARIKRITDNGRVYFVENMAELNGAAAGALGDNLYNIFTIHTTTGIQPYDGVNSIGTGGMGEAFVPGGVAGKWLDIEVKIDGYNKKMTTTVYVKDDENNPYIAADKSMVRNKAVVENNYGKGTTETAFKALERLGFFFRGTNDDLYIDYITVYDESAVVKADVPETVKYDRALKIKLDTDSTIDELDDTVASITGVETAFEYDAETKTITLTPASDLIEGTSYTVTINKSVLDAKGLIYEGATSFTVKARGNIIFDNQFKTAGDLEGWVLGETTVSSDKFSYGVADDAMYLTINEGRDNPDTPALYLDFDDVEYEEGQKIVIETKIKQTGTESNHRSLLKLNRPNKKSFSGNENGHNWYGLVGLRGTQFDATTTDDHSAMGAMFKAADEGLSNLAGKWVDVKIELDGINKVAYVTATPEGSKKSYTATSTIADNSSALADADAPETGFTAFDSLTWLFRSSAGANTLYVDYIKAYEKVDASVTIDAAAMSGYDVKIKGNADIGAYIKTGSTVLENLEGYVDLYNGNEVVDATKTHIKGTNKVVIDPKSDLEAGTYTVKFDKDALAAKGYILEGDAEFDVIVIESADVDLNFEDVAEGEFTDSSWAFDENATGTNRAANVVSENGNNFLRITANGNISINAKNTMITYSKTLATPFIRDMKASTVFEMKMRTNANNLRKLVKFNYPNEGELNVNAYGEIGWNTRSAVVMNKGNLGVAYRDYRPDSQIQGRADNVATYELNQWYTIKTIYHNAEGTASSYVYDEAGTLVGSLEDQALTAWWFSFYDYLETQPQVMHSIDDITIRFRPEGTITLTEDEQFDIDDIKLYNITEITEIAESATIKFMSGETEVKAITEDGNVVPTFEIQSKNDQAAEYYIIAAKYENGRLVGSPQIKEVEITGKQTVTLDAIEVDKDNTGLVVKAFVWNENMAPVCRAAEIKPIVYTIYMAKNGNDANEGYESTPVATLDKAIELANDAYTKGYSTAEIIVADGNYELTGNQITIGSNLKADSLTVRAESKGGAKFVNGVTYKLSDAKKVEDTNITSKLVEESARNNLYVLDLTTKVDIDDIPKVNLPGTYSYAADGLTMKDNATLEITESRDGTCEMFFGGIPMTVARYPDVTADSDGYAYLEEGNFYYNTNSVTRYWMRDKQNTDDYIAVENRVAAPFTVTLDRAKNWTDANQAIAFGYWNWDWATQTVPVASFSADGVMTSTYPSHYGLKAGQRYYVYNLLEEISQPGEYFIDRTTGLMYFMLPDGADITNEEQEITMSLYGDKDNGIINITASNVTIDGLVFTASRGRAVKAYGNNVVIKNCEISGTAGLAASLSGTNSVIEYCNIHDVDGGISLGGGNLSTLTPGNNKVLNNTITNFSRLSKTYTDAIDVSGVGNKASHNNISGGEHLAITLSGVDNEISYNDISYVLQETDDAGAIYTGRTWIDRDNVIKYNYFHDMGNSKHTTGDGKSPVAAILLDDHFADITIFGNIFNNILGHGVRGNGGRDITISNNIFEKCSEGAAHFTDASGNAADYMTHIQGNDGNGGVEQYYGNAVWFNRFGTDLFNADGTSYNPDLVNSANLVYTNNFAVDVSSGGSFGRIGAASGAKEPNTTLLSSNPFNGDYTNHLTIIKNHKTYPLQTFTEIPIGQIGTAGTAGRTE